MSRLIHLGGAASALSSKSKYRPFAAYRRLFPAFAAALLMVVLAACGQPSSPAASADTPLPTSAPAPTTVPTLAATPTPTTPPILTLTDSSGRTVHLPGTPPQRIISLAPSATEILFAIGAGDRIVGVDNYSDYPPAAAEIRQIGAFPPDLELILALEPDLVTAVGITFVDVIESLEDLGIPVVILDSPNVRGVAGSIRLAGIAVGETEAANLLADQIEARIDAVVAALEGAPVLRVFHELDASTPGRPFTVGPGNFVNDLITLAGGANVFADAASAWPQVGLEDVVARDPQVIILADANFGVTAESVKARAGWDGLDAVLNDRLLEVSTELDNQLSRPGPRIADGLEALARYLHPDLFD